MKKEKQAYEAPIMESLELRFEGLVCTSSNKWDNSIQTGTSWGSGSNDYGME